MNNDFWYDVEYYQIQAHKKTGKVLREGWQSYCGGYESLEQAQADNPPGVHRLRFIKRYHEIVAEQEAA
jgi:hypothetical protein